MPFASEHLTFEGHTFVRGECIGCVVKLCAICGKEGGGRYLPSSFKDGDSNVHLSCFVFELGRRVKELENRLRN